MIPPVDAESPPEPTPQAAASPHHAPPTSVLVGAAVGDAHRRNRRIAGALLLLLVVAAATVLGWQWWELRTRVSDVLAAHDTAIASLRAQNDALSQRHEEQATRLADQSRLVDRNGTDIVALQSRIEDTLALMSRISEDLSGGRTRFQLVAAEHLLVLANDRLMLERDVRAALIALETADTRLAALSDPQLFAVREALAQERAALRAVPQPDLTSAALTLASLVERAPRLPLVSHSPEQFKSPAARDIPDDDDASGGWRRLLLAVRTAIASLFTVRRDDNATALRLLPPESEAVIYKILVLRLESARVALWAGDTVALREALRSTGQWLESEFKADDPGVLAMRGDVERLQSLELTPPLPDISRSLAALRARLDAAAATR